MDRDPAPLAERPPTPNATHEVRGGGGVVLHVREWGNPRGPGLLFLHGWSQSDLCWTKQVGDADLADTFRIVTFDLRGHGLSDKPTGPEHYTDSTLWADDLAAVIDHTALEQPVLVAWSYGGFVVADYLRARGDTRLGGINLVDAAVLMSPAFDHIGPAFIRHAPEMCVADLATNITATRRFIRACTFGPLPDDETATALAWTMAVPSLVRGALLARTLDGSDVLSAVTVPVLVTHGRDDAIVSPSMAHHILAACPAATVSWYDRVGHMPFWEAPHRFNAELADLAREATTSRAPQRAHAEAPGVSADL